MAEYRICFNKDGAEVCGVSEVDSFSDKEMRLTLISGEKLLISGNELKITSFTKESGGFFANGKIVFVKVFAKGESIVKRLFK